MPPTPQQVALLSRMHLFRGLNEEDMAFAASCMEQTKVSADALVFEQGEEPAAFYIVMGGRLKVTRYSKRTQEEDMFGFLDEGDFFGLDLFQENRPNQVTVQAVTDVTLLVLDIPHARELFERLPELIPRFRLMIASHNLQIRTPLNWISPEETIYFIGQSHYIYLLAKLAPWLIPGIIMASAFLALLTIPHMTVLLLILGLGLLVATGMCIWHYVDWNNDHYVVTGKRVVFQEKVVLLYDSRQESPIEQVQSLSVDTTMVGRIFHYGKLVIRSFTGTIEFDGITQPQDVMALIQEMQKRSQSSLRQAELRQIEEILKQRIGLVPPKPPPPKPPPAPAQNPQIAKIQKFMADLFHLRYQMGDTIQYRTHWWILVKAIFLPSLILLAVMGLQIWILVRSVSRQMDSFPVLGAFLALCVVWLATAMWWLYNYIDWHNDIYLITSEQVIDISRKPLGNEQKKVAQIKNILNVEYKRLGIIGLLLNYGTVYIRIGESVFTFDDVFNPSDVQRELFNRMSLRTLKERQAQGETERQRMAEWIAAYHRITHKN